MGYQYSDNNDTVSDHIVEVNKKVGTQADFKNACLLTSMYFLDLSMHNFTSDELIEFVAIIKRAKDDLHNLLARGENENS